VLAYGTDFMTDFASVTAASKNGAFITSCICHGCPWPNATALSIDGKSVYNHYADWMAGRTTGKDSIHIDTRTPNQRPAAAPSIVHAPAVRRVLSRGGTGGEGREVVT
jgi:hypothetical protein